MITQRDVCFNPCFTGMMIQTIWGFPGTLTGILFQSLFYWNDDSDFMNSIAMTFMEDVSILVLLE